jgi:hypothetical protein
MRVECIILQGSFREMDGAKERAAQLRKEAAAARKLAAEKDGEADRILEELRASEHAALLDAIQLAGCPLVCPFCGVPETIPEVTFPHLGCYTTGQWTKGYTTKDDWVRASLENGISCAAFYARAEKESKILAGRWRSAR